MNSMTGFGRTVVKDRLGVLTIEISTINSRYLELNIRLPRSYSSLEAKVREFLGGVFDRGKINVNVGLEGPDEATDRFIINKAAARAYTRQLAELKKELKLSGELTVSDLVTLPEVVCPEKSESNMDLAWDRLKRGLQRATSQVVAMRGGEGRAMAADMRKRLQALTRHVRQIERKTANSVRTYAEKLSTRIEQLLQAPVRDRVRLEEEIALFAERTDIGEECIRFKSHIDQYRLTLKAGDAIGRRLNFILQEMNREANTMGAKSADFGISSDVISLKEEIEKLREMVQNVE